MPSQAPGGFLGGVSSKHLHTSDGNQHSRMYSGHSLLGHASDPNLLPLGGPTGAPPNEHMIFDSSPES